MSWALTGTALLMGLAGGPHCVAMCGAACRGVVGSGGAAASRAQATALLLTGRLASYAVGGALVAASASTLATWSSALPWLRPWWAMLQVAALMLGIFLVWRGRQPRWMRQAGAGVVDRVSTVALPASRRPRGWPAWRQRLRPGALGLLWVAWPCGLLQSALLVAALSGSAAQGALNMAAFAAASSLSLVAAPLLWRRVFAGRVQPEAAVRLAGAALVLASGWALLHTVQGDFTTPFCA